MLGGVTEAHNSPNRERVTAPDCVDAAGAAARAYDRTEVPWSLDPAISRIPVGQDVTPPYCTRCARRGLRAVPNTARQHDGVVRDPTRYDPMSYVLHSRQSTRTPNHGITPGAALCSPQASNEHRLSIGELWSLFVPLSATECH